MQRRRRDGRNFGKELFPTHPVHTAPVVLPMEDRFRSIALCHINMSVYTTIVNYTNSSILMLPEILEIR